MGGAITAVIEREFKRFFRQPGRVLSTFVRPLLWLVVIGSGFSALAPGAGAVSYHQYMLPGIFGMVLLFSSMMSALSTVHDREFSPMRMLLVAPLPRGGLVAAKTVASVLLGLAQSAALLPLVPVLGLRPGAMQVAAFIAALAVTAIALSSLGMLIASRVRSIENFAAVMNFLIFPMFFLSGALYPATRLPAFLQPVVLGNPLTYGVDLMRRALVPVSAPAVAPGEFPVWLSLGLLLGFSAVALPLAARLFGREEHLAGILLLRPPKARLHSSPRNAR